jgi:hypothetical protein
VLASAAGDANARSVTSHVRFRNVLLRTEALLFVLILLPSLAGRLGAPGLPNAISRYLDRMIIPRPANKE